LFPISFFFQSKMNVSNLFLCFQSKTNVSNLFLCFQSNLYPIYVSNLHITYFIKIESVWGVKMDVLSHFKIKIFDLENFFFSRYSIWKSLCLPVKNPNFPKIFFASSRAPQKLQKKTVWRNPSINFDLVYRILSKC